MAAFGASPRAQSRQMPSGGEIGRRHEPKQVRLFRSIFVFLIGRSLFPVGLKINYVHKIAKCVQAVHQTAGWGLGHHCHIAFTNARCVQSLRILKVYLEILLLFNGHVKNTPYVALDASTLLQNDHPCQGGPDYISVAILKGCHEHVRLPVKNHALALTF